MARSCCATACENASDLFGMAYVEVLEVHRGGVEWSGLAIEELRRPGGPSIMLVVDLEAVMGSGQFFFHKNHMAMKVQYN